MLLFVSTHGATGVFWKSGIIMFLFECGRKLHVVNVANDDTPLFKKVVSGYCHLLKIVHLEED